MTYASDRAWSDKYIPAVRSIVGPLLLIDAPVERDMHEATDLIVLRARDMTIAARIRRPGYADRYPGQFTIRSMRDNGSRTELEKIIDGWGDWLFYGHASKTDASITDWLLIDLDYFRASLIRHPDLVKHASGIRSNGDGTHFRWFDIRKFPDEVLVAHGCSLYQPASRQAPPSPAPLDIFGNAGAA